MPLTPPVLYKRASWLWLPIAVYYVTCCLGHLEFSLWLVKARPGDAGNYAYAQAVPWLAGCAAIIGLGLLVHRIWRTQHLCLWPYWLIWVVGIAAMDRWLTFSINEVAHLPQYGFLAWMIARALDPQRKNWLMGKVIFWGTILGVGDECLQYLWITTRYSDYLDFNDFLANLMASAAGAMVYYGSSANTPAKKFSLWPSFGKHRLEFILMGVFLASIAGFALLGILHISPPAGQSIPPGGILRLGEFNYAAFLQRSAEHYGSWKSGPRHGSYFVLPPWAGMCIVCIAGFVFSQFGRRPFRDG